jgi:heptaprenyl diphosphate synthase
MKELVEQKVFHSYLLKYIQTPYIDEDKLLILISILEHLELSSNQMENYTLSTMLIQIALDTHDNVPNDSKTNNECSKNKQLTVLAGDYFSGLYYQLLAETDDIQMIKVLSMGVKEVNENKITAYQKEFESIEKLMSCIKVIESSLLIKLFDYFQVGMWKEVIINFLFLKRLVHERKQFTKKGSSLLFEGLKRITLQKSDIKLTELSIEQQKYLLLICDRYIDFSKQVIEKGIKQLPFLNGLLQERFTSILQYHHSIAKTFVEEG